MASKNPEISKYEEEFIPADITPYASDNKKQRTPHDPLLERATRALSSQGRTPHAIDTSLPLHERLARAYGITTTQGGTIYDEAQQHTDSQGINSDRLILGRSSSSDHITIRSASDASSGAIRQVLSANTHVDNLRDLAPGIQRGATFFNRRGKTTQRRDIT